MSGSHAIAAVVPAAGRSRRMGREKTALPWNDSTILETVLDKIAGVAIAGQAIAPVVVVLRPDLSDAADRARRRGARVVVNPRPDDGMIESVRLGIAAISQPVQALLLWPADHPAVAAATLRSLCCAAEPSKAVLLRYQGRRGHPALIGAELIPAIVEIPPGQGLRQLWRARPEIVLEIDVDDPGILVDLDTPADYETALERSS